MPTGFKHTEETKAKLRQIRLGTKMSPEAIYEVIEEFKPDGSWAGFRCRAIASTGKQGKLYIPKDGRLHYQAKKDEDEGLEI